MKQITVDVDRLANAWRVRKSKVLDRLEDIERMAEEDFSFRKIQGRSEPDTGDEAAP